MKRSTKLSLTALALLTSSMAFGAPKTLVFCSEASPSYLNPQLVSDGQVSTLPDNKSITV